MEVSDVNLCQCGAVTVEGETSDGMKFNHSVQKERVSEFFGGLIQVPEEVAYYNCNHCVNNWGVDLCACGSGESPEECESGLDCCGNSMQTVDVVIKRPLWRF